MSNEVQVTYKHLEARSHPWKKQLWIKGRNMTVWQLLCTMWANGETPEEVAQNRGLPVEAVYEALDYYEKNKKLLHAEAEEEKHWLKQHGWDLD